MGYHKKNHGEYIVTLKQVRWLIEWISEKKMIIGFLEKGSLDHQVAGSFIQQPDQRS